MHEQSTQSRRELLKGGLLATGVAITQALPTEVFAGDPASKLDAMKDLQLCAPSGLRQISEDYTQQQAAELQELLAYRKRLYAAREQTGVTNPCGISIPYATQPLSFYARLTKQMLAIPEPNIPGLQQSMLQGWTFHVVEMARAYAKAIKLVPPQVEVVEQFTIKQPNGDPALRDRVVSPRYVVDIDEPQFSMRTTANMIIDGVDGIAEEYRNKMEAAWKSARDAQRRGAAGFTGPLRMQMQIKDIEVSVVREAFMLECFFWSTGAGLITGDHRAIQAPIGTLPTAIT